MDDLRTVPNYTFAEASRCLGIHVSTLTSWFKGQSRAKPFLKMKDPNGKLLSFFEMMQADVLFSMGPGNDTTLRAFRSQLENIHPMDLVNKDCLFDKRSLYRKIGEQIVSLRENGQTYEKSIITPYLKRVNYDANKLAYRVRPFVNRVSDVKFASNLDNIIIDPRICYGTVFHEKIGAPVQTIGKRYALGEKIKELAEDFGTSSNNIEEALMAYSNIYVTIRQAA